MTHLNFAIRIIASILFLGLSACEKSNDLSKANAIESKSESGLSSKRASLPIGLGGQEVWVTERLVNVDTLWSFTDLNSAQLNQCWYRHANTQGSSGQSLQALSSDEIRKLKFSGAALYNQKQAPLLNVIARLEAVGSQESFFNKNLKNVLIDDFIRQNIGQPHASTQVTKKDIETILSAIEAESTGEECASAKDISGQLTALEEPTDLSVLQHPYRIVAQAFSYNKSQAKIFSVGKLPVTKLKDVIITLSKKENFATKLIMQTKMGEAANFSRLEPGTYKICFFQNGKELKCESIYTNENQLVYPIVLTIAG